MNYIDVDYAYFLGMVVARGTISESGGVRQVAINFPHSSLEAQGINVSLDQQTSIKLGLTSIRERMVDLLNADISVVEAEGSIDLVIRFLRNAMPWRNLLAITEQSGVFAVFRFRVSSWTLRHRQTSNGSLPKALPTLPETFVPPIAMWMVVIVSV